MRFLLNVPQTLHGEKGSGRRGNIVTTKTDKEQC